MNGSTFMSNIQQLKTNYMIQIVLSGLIIILNFILLFEIYWLNGLLYYLYFALCLFCIIYIFISIVAFIFIKLKKLTQKSIYKYKIKTLITCVIAIFTGIFFTAILMMNALDSSDFSRECPFNLPNCYINALYNKYENNDLSHKKLKEQCTRRRCLFNNEILDSQYPYEYVCNYDPTDEFDSMNKDNSTTSQIECIEIEKINFNKYNFEMEEIYKFLEMCNFFTEFYICQRVKMPKTYSLDDDYKCPKKNYLSYLIFFSMSSVLFNLIINFISWRALYIKYKTILKILSPNNNRHISTSLNSTQNNTKVEIENKEEQFKKEPTETVIVYTEQNMMEEINNPEHLYINTESDRNIINNNIQKINDLNEENSNNDEDSKKEDTNSIKIFKLKESLSNMNDNEINEEMKNKNFISNSSQTLSFNSNNRK